MLKIHRELIVTCAAAMMLALVSYTSAADRKIKKEKLQIVFLFGQSNMVGLAAVPTAWYLTQPQYKAADLKGRRVISNTGFHYYGSAKCFLLMGDAMGRSLTNLTAGGEPKVHAELKK